MITGRWSVAALCACALACGESEDAAPATPTQLMIVADWLNGSLSYVDRAALDEGGATRADVVTRTIAIEGTAQGPLQLELTHDKKRLLVSDSVGFFGIVGAGIIIGETNLPTGPGALRVFDVESGKQLARIESGDGPMGVAVTPDDKRAFVAHFGSGDIAVIDLETLEVTSRVAIGTYPEEIAFDDTGEVGLVGYSTVGSLKTFAVSDLAGSLTDVPLAGDSAGVAFFPGTKVAYAVQAPNPLSLFSGYTLLDLSDPRAPQTLADVRVSGLDNISYPIVPAPDRGTIVVPVTRGDTLFVEEVELDGDDVRIVQSLPVTNASLLAALGVAYRDGKVYTALVAQHALGVTDLESGMSRIVPWTFDPQRPGPGDIFIR